MAEYDELIIKISADSKQAKSNINSVKQGLVDLEKTAKELDEKQIRQVQKILLDISKIDFSNVSKGLRDVVTAFKQLNSISGKQGGGKKKDAPPLANTVSPNNPSNVLAFKPIDFKTTGFDLEKVVKSTQELQKVDLSGQVKEWLKLEKGVKKTVPAINESKTALGKWIKRAREIAKYRIIRKAIQEIYKALTQGIQQVALFDDATNTSISNIKTSLQYFVNSVGAILSPLIQIVEPLLTNLADLFAEAGNGFAELFASLNGQDTFAQAKKDYIDYRNTLRSATTGIDELNVLNKQDGFQVANTNGAIGNLKEAFQQVGEGLKLISSSVQQAIVKLRPLVQVLGQLVDYLLKSTSDSVSQSIADFVTLLGDILNILGSIAEVTKPLLDFFNVLNSTGINIINRFASAIFQTLSALLDFEHGWDNLGNNLKKIWRDTGNFFIDILNAIADAINGVVNFFYKTIGGGIASWFGVDTSGWQSVDIGKIPHLATGGFPENGFFFANSTELVGRFDNGQTAVANNEQITEGIYQAVLQAMRESGGQNIVIQMDGYEVAKAVTDRQNNFGAGLVKGGNLKFGT